MGKRSDTWRASVRAGLAEIIRARFDNKDRAFALRFSTKPNKLASEQAIYRWLKTGNVSDENLRALAKALEVDLPTLLTEGRFIPQQQPQRHHAVHEAAAGYYVAQLPTPSEIAQRVAGLPIPVQAFLLHQIEHYEELVAINPTLADLMFMPPKSKSYQKFEQELETWPKRKPSP